MIAAILVGAFLLMKSKPAALQKTNYGAMPGNVGTGNAQQLGGVLAGFLNGIKAPANGNQMADNPMTQSNMANANYNNMASINDLAAQQDVVNQLPEDGGDLLANMGF
jgi:hypothetical protein